MNQINKDIKNNEIKQFYLLFGEEGYLKNQYREKLAKALIDIQDTMNYQYAQGNSMDIQSIYDIGETLPFFAERRVLVLENTGFFKKAPEEIEKHFEQFPESTYVIFVEDEVDKRNRFYKWISKNGYAAQMDTPSEKMLLTWVKGLCKEEGKEIEDVAIYYFVEHMGTDMLLLKNELEKLFCYDFHSNVITVEDIKEICVNQAADKIFEMLDAIGNRNQKRALQLYQDLLALREPAMRIMYMLTRHYHILVRVKALSEEGKDNKAIASACGVQEFTVKKYVAQAKMYSYNQLKDMLEQCQKTDQYIKTGRVQDTVGLELLIIDFSK